jgi:hypothetical protein
MPLQGFNLTHAVMGPAQLQEFRNKAIPLACVSTPPE